MLFDATYDGGEIIEHDNYRDMPINDVHDLFIGDNGNFLSIEVASNDENLRPMTVSDFQVVGDSFYCTVEGCTEPGREFKTLQKLRTHQWFSHGRKGPAHAQSSMYWKARAEAHRRGEKWVGQGLPEGWSKGRPKS
jgi:hypothetical protein